jgi:hypothetical protein
MTSLRHSERNPPSFPRACFPAIWPALLFLVLSVLEMTASFPIRTTRHHHRIGTTNLFSILDDGDKNDTVDFSKFNPLSYKSSKSNSAYSYSGTQISLRKTSMQELTNELLNAVGDGVETQQILEDYRDFLLEPLEDLEAVLVRKSCIQSTRRRSHTNTLIASGSRLGIYTSNVTSSAISSVSSIHG